MPIVARIRKAMRRPASVTALPDIPPQSADPLVPEALPSWEEQFTPWIAEARATGADPNDVGDREWGTDRLDHALHPYYIPTARGARPTPRATPC